MLLWVHRCERLGGPRTGVIGLSTALKIQEKGGYRVTILAQHLPGDPKDAYYSSCWAVSTWSSSFVIDYSIASWWDREHIMLLSLALIQGKSVRRMTAYIL